MRVAVVGAGISGLAAAYTLAVTGDADVVLYEGEEYLGGHSRTVTADGIDVDLGFMVFNRVKPLPLSSSLSFLPVDSLQSVVGSMGPILGAAIAYGGAWSLR